MAKNFITKLAEVFSSNKESKNDREIQEVSSSISRNKNFFVKFIGSIRSIQQKRGEIVTPDHEYNFNDIYNAYMTDSYVNIAVNKYILSDGWREIERIFRSSLKEKPEDEDSSTDLPELAEGEIYDNVSAEITEHYTHPPKPFTEDTLLSAMENAGKADMPMKQKEKVWEPLRPGRPSSKSWYQRDLLSARVKISFPQKQV